MGMRSDRDAGRRREGVGRRRVARRPAHGGFAIARTDKGGEGGTVTFSISDKRIEIDGATSLLEPFGCRMGICQTCVLPVESGHIRDFRSGDEHGEGDRINTCISTASGDCTIKG